MLLGIPRLLTGDILKILSDMGHGDEVVIVDANFPAQRVGERVINCPNSSCCDVLGAILRFFPLDHLDRSPAALMAIAEDDECDTPEIWGRFKDCLQAAGYTPIEFDMVERFDFYERATNAYAVIQTGEMALYGNIILRKGVVRNEEHSV